MTTKEALGIKVGDIVSTSYGTGPYRVISIHGPVWWEDNIFYLVVWPYPVISLVVVGPDESEKANHHCFLNEIHQEGERWFNDSGDEIFLLEKDKFPKAPEPKPEQMDMFSLLKPAVENAPKAMPLNEPYKFQEGVDYSDPKHVFHCPICRVDYNGDYWNNGHTCPRCPSGKHLGTMIIIMPEIEPGEKAIGLYGRWMGRE